MGWLHALSTTRRVYGAHFRVAGADRAEFDFLSDRLQISPLQMGFRRDRHRLGELRAGCVRSRVGTAAVVAPRGRAQTERADPRGSLCQFLVRESGHRAPQRRRRRQHHVGIGLPAYRIDLSRFVEVRRALARRLAGRRTKENAIRQRQGAVSARRKKKTKEEWEKILRDSKRERENNK